MLDENIFRFSTSLCKIYTGEILKVSKDFSKCSRGVRISGPYHLRFFVCLCVLEYVFEGMFESTHTHTNRPSHTQRKNSGDEKSGDEKSWRGDEKSSDENSW